MQYPNQENIESILGKKGTFQNDVLKFTFPRYDLKVRVGQVMIEPEFALTSWMAFHQVNGQSMVMGDVVLLEDEIEPAITQVLINGLAVTALHNHLLYDVPRIMYLHISGFGDAVKLAEAIKTIFSVTKMPMIEQAENVTLTQGYWQDVEKIMGKKGNTVGKVIQFSYPRKDVITEFGIQIPPSMGISQAINFQAEGISAAVTGDFVLIANEVYPVVWTLRKYGIAVTVLHNHMLFESPRLFYLHFWAVDDPEKLAYELKEALLQTNSVI